MSMFDIDSSFASLSSINEEFANFCQNAAAVVSETDTRIKLIDRIIKEVLFWPEDIITRENRILDSSGYADYKIKILDKELLVLEAKRESVSFALPRASGRNKLKLSTLMRVNKELESAIKQVREYCDDLGVKYAIATNGYTWIIFRAIRDDMPWKEAQALVFYDLDDIKDKFTEFWNLLSFESLSAGTIDSTFLSIPIVTRGQYKVLNKLFNADLPLERNRFSAQLDPFISVFFKDIADQDYIEILETCYIHSRSMKSLENAITDAIPKFLLNDGAVDIRTGVAHAGVFQKDIEKSVLNLKPKGELFLILGGIGCGKTTFLKRYFKSVGADFLSNSTVWFYIDLLGSPEPQELENDILTRILEQYRSQYSKIVIENRRNIKKIFEKELDVLYETRFKAEGLKQNELEKAISPSLEKWQSDPKLYVPRLLQLCQQRNKVPVICIDNVDQLPSASQAQIFLTAQNITRTSGSLTILALREETYYSTRIQKTFTAYTNQKYHIASPYFLALIYKRLNSACKALEQDQEDLKKMLNCSITLETDKILDLFKIIQESFCQKNRNIIRFVESLCFGNMRQALNMFATYLISGATDIDKMLRIYNREREDGSKNHYYVSFHEFAKSIMLGDRRYYRETESKVMNLFNCGVEYQSSHFTSLRILNFLQRRVNMYTREGEGYVDIASVLDVIESVFDNREDFVKTINRLLHWSLVEVNTRSTDTIIGANYVRITSAGTYYINYLVNSFCYLDLVLQDTPLDNEYVADRLVKMVRDVDNLIDKDSEKLARVSIRLERVSIFLEYLKEQEEKEFARNQKLINLSEFSDKFTDRITQAYQQERDRIIKRLTENAEKYVQSIIQDSGEFDIGELDWEMISLDTATKQNAIEK